jgi:hypothetical protein
MPKQLSDEAYRVERCLWAGHKIALVSESHCNVLLSRLTFDSENNG